MPPKLTLKRPSYRSWTFVLILGVVLATVALIERGGVEVARADGSTGCQLEVTTDQLNVRAGPAQEAELIGTLARGELVDGTREVTDGFRELEDGSFVADQFLTPVPGTDCG
ncbi:SH3 domain-containing protein [Pseudonocardia sp.]|uniref:SH3 domain-containing protein n=1 Tax=Pseudonocardia sp. TaxID=60912 RepID=UPI00261713D8|nr:SH3 domain-containing protein [Pseudonocardia sp.]